MKRAVSISIGSKKRDKVVEVEILGQHVALERIGTDGDMEAAARLYSELDGKVDAFGVGGALLGFMIDTQWYSLHSIKPLTRFVKYTPVVDGTGLKMTLERKAASVIADSSLINPKPKRALLISAVDRYGLSRSFMDAGYEYVIGDLMFSLGITIPIKSDAGLKKVARILIPTAGRLPFSWLYPTGESQNKRTPKFTKYFQWADVIAGDCHYITKYMPDDMENKIIVTNTTTEEDRIIFKNAGIKYLITTTPMYEGRSFGTNVLEAGIVSALGITQPINYAAPGDYFEKMSTALEQLNIKPNLMEL